MKDLVEGLERPPVGRVLWDRHRVDKSGSSKLPAGRAAAAEARPANLEIATGLGHTA